MEVVSGAVAGVKHFLESHGWKLIGLTIAWYMVKDDLYNHFAKKEKAARLAAANDPARVAVLEAERLRVREGQQRRATVELAEARAAAAKAKAERQALAEQG